MVKKSFLARLFGRDEANGATEEPVMPRKAPQARAAETSRPAAPHAAQRPEPRLVIQEAVQSTPASRAKVEEVELTPVEQAPPSPPSEPRPATGPNLKATEMTRQEEVAVRLQEGFQGINQVLSGIDRKIDQQQRSSDELMLSVRKIPELMKDVPDASRAGLELLATISSVMEQQSRTSQELLHRLQDVPKLMDAVEARLRNESKATAEAAAAARVAAERSASSAEATLGDVRTKVDGLADSYSKRQEELMAELRRQQTENDRRIDLVLKKSASTTKVMIFLVVLAIAAFLLVVNALSGH
jgi:hypothetical protein